MDIRIYNAFDTTAELLNVTRAAERLNMTQSALSRQLKSLEDHLGIALFEKTGRNIRLTPEGEALYGRITNVLAADRNLMTYARDLARGDSGLIRIGACSQLMERYFPQFLRRWRAQNPGIEIRLEDGGGPELAQKLLDGKIHLSVSALPSTPHDLLETALLGQLGFLAVGERGLLPEGNAPIELEDLLEKPILTLNGKHASRELFDAACKISGRTAEIILESNSPHTLFAMATCGNGIAVVPSSAQPPLDTLTSRPIALNGEVVRFAICAMWNKRLPLPAYGQRFITQLGAHIDTDQALEDGRLPGARYGRLEAI
ncbi:LysR family transcriptional regulator [Thioclava sp.]|uniref:LysR family transcriptional regulator n=1 Tax=Thioclava sp. TaxID=1933450 RepID=UPI003AA84C92